MSNIFIFFMIAIPIFAAFGIEEWFDEKKEARMEKLLLSPEETAEKLGLGINKTRELMQKDSFPKVYNGTRAMAIASELAEWVKAHKGGQI